MNKKLKLFTIVGLAFIMLASWAFLFFTDTKEQQSNYYWQIGMGLCAVVFAFFGLMTSQKWGMLRSGVGRGIFFISLGLLMWAIGQLWWSFFLFATPGVEAPQSHLLDLVDFMAIPLWFVGVIMLSQATGARYGLRTIWGKIFVVVFSAAMIAASYYFLVIVARGGNAYFDQTILKQFFDLGYSVADSVLCATSIAIFALSWKLLGGRFKLPISVILLGFVLLFISDFSFSYYDGRAEYYNGNISDLFFMLTVVALGLGLSMLDPSHIRKTQYVVEENQKPSTTTTVAEAPVHADGTAPTIAELAQPPSTDAVPNTTIETSTPQPSTETSIPITTTEASTQSAVQADQEPIAPQGEQQ
jgi:hypothetical protein